ncbi:hypothetical protein [Rhodohalobacter sp. 8-1]|uniref:hypothetical protein n=1 Tax=Rhodohalobacter sp. 8-1 TaxID=3131972 RepID=UPI0030EB1C86
MNTKERVIMAFAALLLGLVFFVPIWTIDMDAPQYPEGIGMEISINDIEGKNKNDLQNINGLNHYIGMQEIEPDSIPELDIMPWIFAFLIVSGVGVAIWGNRMALLIWIILFILFAIAGLVDFYLWTYDYGHNLSEDAAIKIPGMTYQPPIIGTKQLLNITASSWPGLGFYISVVSMGLASYAFWSSKSHS